jgi:hypothetical protein
VCNFSSSWGPVSFSGRTLLHGVSIFKCFVQFLVKTQIISPHSMNYLVFIMDFVSSLWCEKWIHIIYLYVLLQRVMYHWNSMQFWFLLHVLFHHPHPFQTAIHLVSLSVHAVRQDIKFTNHTTIWFRLNFLWYSKHPLIEYIYLTCFCYGYNTYLIFLSIFI